jgi:hypothetical protein
MALADNPEALAHYIEGLGGTIVYDTKRFRFELPLSEVRRVIPDINRHGLACKKVEPERQDRDINGRMCSVATIEVSRDTGEPHRHSYNGSGDLLNALHWWK